MVAHGTGIAIVDEISANKYQGKEVVFLPYTPSIELKVWLMRPRMRPRSMVVDEFTSLLFESVRDIAKLDFS